MLEVSLGRYATQVFWLFAEVDSQLFGMPLEWVVSVFFLCNLLYLLDTLPSLSILLPIGQVSLVLQVFV